MKTCSKCNINFDDSKKFCKKCGSQLVSVQAIDANNEVSEGQIGLQPTADVIIIKDKKPFNRIVVIGILVTLILLISVAAIFFDKQINKNKATLTAETNVSLSKSKRIPAPSANLAATSNSALSATDKYPTKQSTAVNDFAKVIDPASISKMEAMAREVLQKTGTAVVVVTVPTIGEGEETSLYVNGLYKAWGIGKKGEDKGVLIFLTVKERKIRIETGYGVEGILPDGLVGEIRDTYLKPQLQAGNYGQAFYDTMYACSFYIAKAAGVQLSKKQ